MTANTTSKENSLLTFSKVERLFFFTAFSYAIIAFCLYLGIPKSSMDIQLQDTRLILSFYSISNIIAFLFFVQGLFYLTFRIIGFDLFLGFSITHFWLVFFAVFLQIVNHTYLFFEISDSISDPTILKADEKFWFSIVLLLLALIMLVLNLGGSLIEWILKTKN